MPLMPMPGTETEVGCRRTQHDADRGTRTEHSETDTSPAPYRLTEAG